MKIQKYSEHENIDECLKSGEAMLAVISYDGAQVYIGHIDECFEHHILLKKVGYNENDIDKFFRIVFNNSGADWTFVCPQNYKNIADKTRRIASYYHDGFGVISEFLLNILGKTVGINIQQRYQRHLKELKEDK